jgi:hypothetical protein
MPVPRALLELDPCSAPLSHRSLILVKPVALGFNLHMKLAAFMVPLYHISYHLCQIVEVLENNRLICKVTLSLGLLSPPIPSFSGIRQVMKIY